MEAKGEGSQSEAEAETQRSEVHPVQSTVPIKARVIAGRLSQKRRSLLLIRGAERLDRVFPDWIQRAFQANGAYEPYDLNFPTTLPTRLPSAFHNDPPITALGRSTASILGRALRHRQISPTLVLCSPALRSIQTAAALCAEFGADRSSICVEPGLFEPLGWYTSVPHFLSLSDLTEAGYPICDDYTQFTCTEELRPLAGKETDAEAETRIGATLGRLLESDRFSPATVALVVGHAFTLDAALRTLSPDAKFPIVGRGFLGLAYPYTTLLALSEHHDTSAWTLHTRSPLPCPPLHTARFSSLPFTHLMQSLHLPPVL